MKQFHPILCCLMSVVAVVGGGCQLSSREVADIPMPIERGRKIDGTIARDALHEKVLDIREGSGKSGASHFISDRHFESAEECMEYLSNLPRERFQYGVRLTVCKLCWMIKSATRSLSFAYRITLIASCNPVSIETPITKGYLGLSSQRIRCMS